MDITDHWFTVRRQDGIGPHPDTMACARCGAPKSTHRAPCVGALTIAGQTYRCELTAPHDGWGHSNSVAQAVWQ